MKKGLLGEIMRILSFIYLLSLVLTVSGCGGKSEPPAPPPPPPKPTEPYIKDAEIIRLDDLKDKMSIYVTKFSLVNPIDPVEIKEVKFQTKEGVDLPQVSFVIPNLDVEATKFLNRDIDFASAGRNADKMEASLLEMYPEDVIQNYFEGRKPLVKSKLKVESGFFKAKIDFEDIQSIIFKDQTIATRQVLITKNTELDEIKLVILLKKGEEFKQASALIKPIAYTDPKGPNNEEVIKYLNDTTPPWAKIEDIKINERHLDLENGDPRVFINVSISDMSLEDYYSHAKDHVPEGLTSYSMQDGYVFVREISKKGKKEVIDFDVEYIHKNFKWVSPYDEPDYSTEDYKSSPDAFNQDGKKTLVIDSEEYKQAVEENIKIQEEKKIAAEKVLISRLNQIRKNCENGFYLGKFKLGENIEYFSLKINDSKNEIPGMMHFSSSYATKIIKPSVEVNPYTLNPSLNIDEVKIVNTPRRRSDTKTSYNFTISDNGFEDGRYYASYDKGNVDIRFISNDDAIKEIKSKLVESPGKLGQGRRVHNLIMKLEFDGLKAKGTVTYPNVDNVVKSLEGEIKLTNHGPLLELKELEKISEGKSSAYIGLYYAMSLNYNGNLGGLWSYKNEKGQLVMKSDK